MADFRITNGTARDIAADWTAGVYNSPLPQGAAVAGATRPARRWGGMTGRSLVESTPATGDADWNDVVLLLRAEDNETDATGRHTVTSNTGGFSTSVPFATSNTKSFDFSGTSTDKRTMPNSTDFQFGADPFTVEFWFRPGSVSGFKKMWQNYGGNGNSLLMALNGSSILFYMSQSGSSWDLVSAASGNVSTVSANTWYHIALVRETGGDVWCYLDGVKGSSAVYSGTAAIYNNTVDDMVVGGGGTASQMVGQIDEVRVTKGVARDIAADWTAGVYNSPLPQGPAVAGTTNVLTTGVLSLAEHYQGAL